MWPLVFHHCQSSEHEFTNHRGGSADGRVEPRVLTSSRFSPPGRMVSFPVFFFFMLDYLPGFLYTPNWMDFLVFLWSLYSDKILNMCFLGRTRE